MFVSKKAKYIICLMLIAILTVSCALFRKGPKDSPRDKDKKERYDDDRRDRR